jgi:pyruvate dehydrogenase E2 component (dihydrolipoamide acetyltransferase)
MDFLLPDLGEGISSATVVKVYVKAGDTVTAGQSLADVETDKATMPVEAPKDGTISQVLVKNGDKIAPGSPFVVYGSTKETKTTTPTATPNTTPKPSTTQPVSTPSVNSQPNKQEFVLPSLGEGIDVGTIVDIHIKVGDTISKEQDTFSIETDKATMPIPSPFDGKVEEIKIAKGDKVRIGQVLAIMSVQAGTTTTPSTPTQTTTPVSTTKVTTNTQPVTPNTSDNGIVSNNPKLPVPAGPATRRYARELGVNLREVRGTARGGRITVDDVKAYVRNRMSQPTGSQGTGGGITIPPLPDFSKWGPIETKPASNLRMAIARNLTLSWNVAPMVTQFDLADITDLEAGRKRIVESLPKGSPKVTMTILAIKAVVAALKEFPNFNSALDTANAQVIRKNYYHIGIAVDTEKGLVVPVIRDADKKSIRDLAKDVTELAEKARSGKLSLDEMRGGTFTITNLGGIGGTAFSPIINYPEVAILGMSRSSMQPIVRDGKVEARLMLPLCLTYDHRIIDGADGARFTTRLVQLFSDPIRLLMES